ncbi:hypothetical protein evm_012038 [Chilo suppressalis]|nr:hypothetical protein evm_012038 [Chilo suppressalis]
MKALIVFSLVLAVAVATPAIMKDAYDFIKDMPKDTIVTPKVSVEMPKKGEQPKLENPPELMVDPPKPEDGDDMGPMDLDMFAIFANYADPLPGQMR